jgi:hypothetical protein
MITEVRTACATLIVLFVVQATQAQTVDGEETPGALVEQVFSAAVKTKDDVMRRFNSALQKKAPELADGNVQVSVRVQFDFGAFSALSPLQIRLPHMFLLEQWLTAEGAATMEMRPEIPRDALQQYMGYLSSRSRTTLAEERKKVVYQRFGSWIRLAVRPFTAYESQRHHGITELMMRDAVAFALAHELGHLAYKHRSPVSGWRVGHSQEYEADRFATELLRESGMANIAGAMLQLPRFSTEEYKYRQTNLGTRRTHPSPECRMLRLMLVGDTATMLQDPATRRAALQRGGISEVEYQQVLKEGKKECEFEFDTIANTVVLAPPCEDLVGAMKKFSKNPSRFHGNDKQEGRVDVFSTTPEKLQGADRCSLYTTSDPQDLSFDYSCKWPFSTGDQARANEQAERTSQHVGQCFGVSLKKTSPGQVVVFRAKPDVQGVDGAGLVVRSNANPIGVEIQIKGEYKR